jgi:hypothetical protein
MKNTSWVILIIPTLLSSHALAYGGGGGSSTKACDKPKFSEFTPPANAEVASGSAFSFTASKNTYPSTIKVTIKDRPVEVKTQEQANGVFEVSGKFPEGVKDSYARIAINADAQSNCKGSGGWLVKIKE